ncbi:MAG: copper amine oxidase N-terminal domain-containing protein [Clostridia bacterium]|nr:copper amine oxidase N-terminal domain-containing protein [Clostridia bacterium]MDH7572486.1 copper amine oxidase N-terminal domain-containing protein [Clostridia bacterium]
MLRTRRKSISLLVALAFVLTLVLPVGAALAAASATLSPSSINESALDGAELTIRLSGDAFVQDGTLDKANFTPNNAPAGLSVAYALFIDAQTAKIGLVFSGEFDENIEDFSIKIAGAELQGGADLTTNDITLVAEAEEWITVTGVDIVEGKESEGKLVITLEGEGVTFAAGIAATEVTLSDAPTGVAVDTVTRVSDTRIEVKLKDATKDYDTDVRATVAVDHDKNTGTNSLTATYTFKATKEAIEVTGSTVEGKEDGAVLTVNLTASDTDVCYFKNDEDALLENVTMYGQPTGVSLDWVEYVDEDTIKLHLAGNATYDYDTDKKATIRVKTGALEWNTDTLSATFTFKATVEEEEVSDLDKYANGLSYGYQYVTTGENKEAGWAAIRLPEDPDVPRYADKLVVSVTLPDGALYMAPAKDSTLDDYVTVIDPEGKADVDLVSASRDQLEVALTGMDSPLDLAVVFNFDVEDGSALEIDGDFSGDLEVTLEYVGFDGNKTVFSDREDLLIARVTGADVTVSAASAKTVAVGSEREAAEITVEEGSAGTLEGATVTLEIVSDGASFNSADITTVRYEAVDDYDLDEGDTVLTFEVGDQTIGLPGKVKITPYLDLTPDADEEIEIAVTVEDSSGDELASETVTVAKVSEAVSFAVTDVKNTGGKITAGHDGAVLKESGKAAQLTIEPVGSKYLPDALVYVEITGAKFDPDTPFEVSNGKAVKTYKDNKAAYFAVEADDKDDEVTLKNFKVSAAGDAAAGDIVLKFSSNGGDFDPAEVVIGQVVKPFEVTASSAPEMAYLGQGQAAGDIVIKETGKGSILDDFRLVLPDGVAFAAKPDVKVTAGNIDLKASLKDGGKALLVDVTDTSSVASTITISGIKYDVNRLAIDGDVKVTIVGDPDTEEDSPLWADQVLAAVVNAKVVSAAAARTASFTIGSTTYTVNGKEYTMDVAPYIKEGRTYVPVRYVATALGVSEDNIFYASGQVSLLKDGRAVQLTIGSKTMVVNGVAVTMDVAPEIQAGRTMLPFRWIATALGASVSWNEETKTVTMKVE